MNKLLIIMLSVALVSVGCSPANKKSSNSKPEAVKQSKPEAVKQSSSVLKQSSSVLGDVDNQLVSSLANKKAPPLWEDYTKEDRALFMEYQSLYQDCMRPYSSVISHMTRVKEREKELNAISKDDPSRKAERIEIQGVINSLLDRIRIEGHPFFPLKEENIRASPRLKELHNYFTINGTTLTNSINVAFNSLPSPLEVEKESDN